MGARSGEKAETGLNKLKNKTDAKNAHTEASQAQRTPAREPAHGTTVNAQGL
jgi:hypothetical protein